MMPTLSNVFPAWAAGRRDQRVLRAWVKRFAIVHPDFTQETGELTPSMKLKRRVVMQKHRGTVEKLYENGEN